jgi:hypothetical protein
MTESSIWDSQIVINACSHVYEWDEQTITDGMTEAADWAVIHNPGYQIMFRHIGLYASDPAYFRAAQKRYRHKPEYRNKIRTRSQNRRTRVRELPNTLTNDQWEHTLEYFGYKCAVCGKPADFWTVLAQDHWVAVTNGGGTIAKNIVPLCHPKHDAPIGESYCNSSKGTSDPYEWLEKRYGKRKALSILKRIETYFETV